MFLCTKSQSEMLNGCHPYLKLESYCHIKICRCFYRHKRSIFSSSLDPLSQFRPNLAQCILLIKEYIVYYNKEQRPIKN